MQLQIKLRPLSLSLSLKKTSCLAMDKYRQFSSTEECSSSESGWTMYLNSPMQEDDGECTELESDEHNHHHGRGNECENEQNSDDSMASDASSGPSHGRNKQRDHKRSKDEKATRVDQNSKNNSRRGFWGHGKQNRK